MARLRHYVSACICGLLISACSTTTSPELQQALRVFQATSNDPVVVRAAPTALAEARQNLDSAAAAEEVGEPSTAGHYAGLAQRYLEIARTQAQRAQLQVEAEAATEQREQLRRELGQQQVAARRAVEAEQRANKLREELAALGAERTQRGLVVTLGGDLFDSGQAELTSDGQRSAERLAKFLSDYPERRVRIEGHTDDVGAAAFNEDLARRRAAAVSAALTSNGISAERIATVGLGEAYPKASNDTEAGRRQNRRVEVVISDTDGKIGRRG